MSARIGSLCTGYGGLDMAVQQVFGGDVAWIADIDPGARQILAHRHPGVPNIGDLTAVDWDQVEPVDIVCGGYPCQPFSTAGHRKGTTDARHIWPHIARALGVLRPRLAIFENVAGHLSLGFDTVLADLAGLGFDAEWCTVRASDVGAAHQRNRLFILAWPADAPGPGRQGQGLPGRPARGGVPAADALDIGSDGNRARGTGRDESAARRVAPADTDDERGNRNRTGAGPRGHQPADQDRDPQWGLFAPAIQRWEAVTGRAAPGATDDRRRLSPLFVEWLMGLPAGHVTDVPDLTRTAQLKALGNGVVPQQAVAALRLLTARAEPVPASRARKPPSALAVPQEPHPAPPGPHTPAQAAA